MVCGHESLWRDKVLDSINEIESPTEKMIKILNNYKDRYLKDSENFPVGCIFITFSVELDDTRPHLMKEVNKGFEGFIAMLTRLLDDAIDQGELPKDINSGSVAETLFAGMLGASVLFGVHKDNSTLDNSIDSLIEYLYFLNNMQLPDYIQQNEST